jgi:hypothetical protein
LIRQGNVQLLHESSPRGVVQLLRTIGRADDQHLSLPAVPRAIELDEEFRLDASAGLVFVGLALRQHGIYLVDEYHGWGAIGGHGE